MVTLDEIEHVHFQRVTFRTSTADMIIIFKDYKRPAVEIDAVKVSDMDKIKEWLDSINIVANGPGFEIDLHGVGDVLQLEGVYERGARLRSILDGYR